MAVKVQLNTRALKALRTQKGLSQEGLAKACEAKQFRLSIATIKRAEAGKPVGFRTANELARFHAVALEALLADSLSGMAGRQGPGTVNTALWVRVEDTSILDALADLIGARGAIHQERLGSLLLAAFANNDAESKGYLHAHYAALGALRYARSEASNIYLALQLAPGTPFSKQSFFRQETLQWFASLSPEIPANTLYVSDDLYDLAADHFRYRPASRAGVWELLGEQSLDNLLPLSGRETELTRVLEFFAGVDDQSRAAIMLLRGEAGIGKTRLRAAVHAALEPLDIVIVSIDLETGWLELDQALAGLLLRSLNLALDGLVKREALLDHASNGDAAVRQFVHTFFFDATQPRQEVWPSHAGLDMSRLPEVVARVFASARVLSGCRLVLSMDNLHLLDTAGFEFFNQLLLQLESLPVQALLTSHPTPAQEIFMQRLARQGFALDSVSLGPLDEQAGRQICQGFSGVPEDYAERCLDLAQGVPLYLIQLMGAYRHDRGALPTSLGVLVERKLHQLTGPERQALEVLSVLRAPVALEALRELMNEPFYQPHGLLERHLIQPTMDGQLQMSHQLVQHLVYEKLDLAKRASLHRQVANFLEAQPGRCRAVGVRQMAHHFSQGGDDYKSAYYGFRWASTLLQQGQYDDAQVVLEESLQRLTPLTHPGRDDLEVDLQLALSTVYKVKYGWVSPLLKATYDRVNELSQQLGADARQSLALFGLWTIELGTLNFTGAEAMALKLLTSACSIGDAQGQMYAQVALSNTLFWRGRHTEAELAAASALTGFKESYLESSLALLGMDPRALAGCFGALSASLAGHEAEASHYRDAMLGQIRAIDHDFSLAIALQGSAWLEYHRDDAAATLAEAEQLEALAKARNFPFYRGVAALFASWARHRLHDDPDAAQHAHEGYWRWLAASGDKVAYSLYGVTLGSIYVESARFQEARELLEQCIKVATARGEDCYLPELFRLLALCPGEHKRRALEQGLLYAKDSPLLKARLDALLD
ncbi:AAA family ATPase [Gilvimarinus algae]|uniref:AAA family ATPase n=1 Tax=Gilvimarinus algae TaxID=3058037 RepID=A0ABT8THN4_9GAMM|nr:AAA family ATPase [Gilvimarinus sp. SDUM040014]MDO3383611.1 AAA family ATPase [Gilvimarinus sp. SDUM040014]